MFLLCRRARIVPEGVLLFLSVLFSDRLDSLTLTPVHDVIRRSTPLIFVTSAYLITLIIVFIVF